MKALSRPEFTYERHLHGVGEGGQRVVAGMEGRAVFNFAWAYAKSALKPRSLGTKCRNSAVVDNLASQVAGRAVVEAATVIDILCVHLVTEFVAHGHHLIVDAKSQNGRAPQRQAKEFAPKHHPPASPMRLCASKRSACRGWSAQGSVWD